MLRNVSISETCRTCGRRYAGPLIIRIQENGLMTINMDFRHIGRSASASLACAVVLSAWSLAARADEAPPAPVVVAAAQGSEAPAPAKPPEPPPPAPDP